MTDRQVTQIERVTKDAENPLRRFSEFADYPNIVVLGDPGAGKSHLFEHAAKTAGGEFLSARAFLNIPRVDSDSALFIDALDERRSGRGDQDTIDKVVQKLFATNAARVRISCRAADWLGATDLAAFRPYFDTHGGAIVLA
jgi:predicted NACHT family NTPase